MQPLPTSYFLEVYEDSFINDPSFYINSLTPFTSINIGDFFNHRGIDTWHNSPDTATEKFVITQIEHIFLSIGKEKNTQKTMIVVKATKYDWDK